VTASAAVERHVEPGARVLLGTAAGAALTLQRALVEQRDRLAGLRLSSGLQLGGYDFMGSVRDGAWTYDTWHVMPAIRDDVACGRAGLHLMRGSRVAPRIAADPPDVFLTVVSPPDDEGYVSLGASVSYAMTACRVAGRVIAEVNPEMPYCYGDTRVPVSAFAALVDAEQPLPSHSARPPSPEDVRIAEHVRALLPDRATLQIGLGSVPEALVALLGADPPPGLRLYGMGIDQMVPVLPLLGTPFVGGELLGSRALYAFAHRNPLVEQYPAEVVLSVPHLASIPRFVSLNGALQVDRTGQVNSEWVNGRQVSGPGGSVDFVEAAGLSDGGLSVVALRATALDGTVSAIVPALPPGAPVTIPRHSVQVVVTEHGVADLRGLSLPARAEALAAIAAPEFRAALVESSS
jgi:4-hydroxybutyrate CoA-transferase